MKRVLVCLALAGCYSPEARDCTVSCTAATECINGQVCGKDHLCAAPSVAGHCNAVDGSVTPPDAHDQDVMLVISVMGGGTVSIDDIGVCNNDMCQFPVPPHVTRNLTASTDKPDKPFAMWMDACAGTTPTCSIVPSMNTHVGAKFQ